MFNNVSAETIRKMDHEELKKYIYAIPREYEESVELPKEIKIHGRSFYEVCEASRKIESLMVYGAMNVPKDVPERELIVSRLIAASKRYDEDIKQFDSGKYIVVPMTRRGYLFEEVREAYAKNAEFVAQKRRDNIAKRLKEILHENNEKSAIRYKKAADRLIDIIEKANNK